MVEMLSNLLKESLIGTVYFPFWWYSSGLTIVARKLYYSFDDFNDGLGFSIWLRNIFTPLFNQRDVAGRVVSFFLRLVNIIVRGLAMIFIGLIHLTLFFIWLVAPIFFLLKVFF